MSERPSSSGGSTTPKIKLKVTPGTASAESTPPALTAPSPLASQQVDTLTDHLRDRDVDRMLPLLDQASSAMYGTILDRTVKLQYEALKDLVERQLPATPIQNRNKLIIDYTQNARVTLLKLLALLRWNNQANVDRVTENGTRVGSVTNAVRLDAWIDDQHEHVRNLREHLSTMIARTDELSVRQPDVYTAIDVLSTGTYSGLPLSIQAWADPPVAPLTIDEKRDVLKQMNAGIKSRMRLHESIPEGIEIVDIRDGKLYLEANALFTCTLTTDVSHWQNPWYLLDVRFTSTTAGQVDELPDSVKAGITQMVDPLLRYAPAETSTSTVDPKNTSLYKLYDVLEHLSLSYRLEEMFMQAVKLVRAEWTENLQAEMAPDRSSFRLSYWARPQEEAPPPNRSSAATPSQRKGSANGGTITISISLDPEPLDPLRMASQALLGGSVPAPRKRIRTAWTPSPDWLGFQDVALPPVDQDIDTIDVKEIVSRATRLHADALCSAIHGHMLAAIYAGRQFAPHQLSFVQTVVGGHIDLELFGSRGIRVSINPVTGRLGIKERVAVVASVIEDRLRDAANLVNPRIGRILDVVLSLTISFVLDALEENFAFFGLTPARSLPVPLSDMAEQGLVPSPASRSTKPIIVVPLCAVPEHYLLILVDPFGLRFATVQLVIGHAQHTSQRSIVSLTWFDPSISLSSAYRTTSGEAEGPSAAITTEAIPPLRHDISGPELEIIFAYANSLVIMVLIAAQLKILNVPYRTVDSSPAALRRMPAGVSAISARLQHALVQSADVDVFTRDAIIALKDWRDYRSPIIIASTPLALARVKSTMRSKAPQSGSGTSYDAHKAVLSFASDNIPGLIDKLLASWSELTPFIGIASCITRSIRDFKPAMSLMDLQMGALTVKYNEHWTVGVTAAGKDDDLRLDFRNLPQGPENPHGEICEMLEEAFHDLPRSPGLSKQLLKYLRATGDCLGMIKSRIASRADLVICNPSTFLIIRGKETMKQCVEVTYTPQGSRFIIGDAMLSAFSLRYEQAIGPLQIITGLGAILRNVREAHHAHSAPEQCLVVDNGTRLVCACEGISDVMGAMLDGWLHAPDVAGTR